jgi:hypothetical protein
MISGEDIEAFRAESEPAFEEGRKFVKRCAKGIPADRWTTTAGMQLVAECIKRQWAVMDMLSDALKSMQAEMMRQSDESVGCFDRNGNQTS